MSLAAAALAAVLAGAPIDLPVGEPFIPAVPGAFCDEGCADDIRRERSVCEEENRRLTSALLEQAQPSSGKTMALVAGVSLLAGVVLGLVAVGATK